MELKTLILQDIDTLESTTLFACIPTNKEEILFLHRIINYVQVKDAKEQYRMWKEYETKYSV